MAVISYKCPNCNGELAFDPRTQKYKCEYCMSLFTQAEIEATQRLEAQEGTVQQETVTESGTETADMAVYNCPSCGAEIVTDPTTAATYCYYCQSPVVLGGRLAGQFLPNRVIPFQIDKKKAEDDFLKFVGSRKFVPKAFFNKRDISKLSGVYFPYWLYSADLQGGMTVEANSTRTWRSGDTEYTETKVYEVHREGYIRMINRPKNGLQKANAKLAAGILPYRFEEMKDFTITYLTGFLAEKRDIETTAIAQETQQESRSDAESLMKSTITGYSSMKVLNANFVTTSDDWKYVLLPVWTFTYKGKDGKIYYYSMNGQTGKVCGELPIDSGKVFRTAAIIFAIVCALLLLGGYLI